MNWKDVIVSKDNNDELNVININTSNSKQWIESNDLKQDTVPQKSVMDSGNVTDFQLEIDVFENADRHSDKNHDSGFIDNARLNSFTLLPIVN
jgi:hypothetical protein